MGEAAAVLEAEVDDSGREVNRGARVVKRKEKSASSIDPRAVFHFSCHIFLFFLWSFFPRYAT